MHMACFGNHDVTGKAISKKLEFWLSAARLVTQQHAQQRSRYLITGGTTRLQGLIVIPKIHFLQRYCIKCVWC